MMTPEERAEYMGRVASDGPARGSTDWLQVEMLLTLRRSIEKVAESAKEIAATSDGVAKMQAEIYETAEALRADRNERLDKIIEPMATLTGALVNMSVASARADGAKMIEEEAKASVTSLANAAKRAIALVSGSKLALPWATFALTLLQWVAVLYLLFRR